ncbi:hypothetical protein EV644_12411 [Kribbella orskensis]|uniref:Uncharacterized protein n=1 Tax=Kribbella orskensis TaxID=2512216 RepID=A0ABY2B9L9_9ACTN|nr:MULTISPECIES: hypothetical protein [Kribbella]TCN32795.1 hypothetical protein EV642_12687 [Kribbella sp. VKM Ac-2500]TCO12887.1 hypothetical protein EV644_12411 [Kribbella orskensis]
MREDSSHGSGKARLLTFGVLLLVAAVAAAVLSWAASSRPAGNTLRYEAAKTALQILAVVVIGGFATLATFTYQSTRTQEMQRLARQEERRHRLEDLAADKRDRQDDALRTLLQDTLVSYNATKKLRRKLRAVIEERFTIEAYDKYMFELIDRQLEFEQFARLCPLIDDNRLQNPLIGEPTHLLDPRPECESLEYSYRKIERYLNRIIREYEKSRAKVASTPAGIPISNLSKLSAFLGSRFPRVASRHMDKIVVILHTAVLQPPHLTPEPPTVRRERPRQPRPDTPVVSSG